MASIPALSILYDCTGDKELSERLHQDFKRTYVAGWGTEWRITETEVRAWLLAKGGTRQHGGCGLGSFGYRLIPRPVEPKATIRRTFEVRFRDNLRVYQGVILGSLVPHLLQ